MAYRPVEDIEPDGDTIENIRTMVERSLRFFNQYGPKVLDGLTFEGGYTGYVATGDGDFLTNDTLWDFKVSKKNFKTNTPSSCLCIGVWDFILFILNMRM